MARLQRQMRCDGLELSRTAASSMRCCTHARRWVVPEAKFSIYGNVAGDATRQ